MSAPVIRRIATPDAPAPAGHYVQATACAGLLHVSGQLPRAADGALLEGASFADQARQALTNLLAVLRAGGCGPADVLKLNAYVVGVAHWPAFDAVMREMFGDVKPARAVIPVAELHYGMLIEVDCVAACAD